MKSTVFKIVENENASKPQTKAPSKDKKKASQNNLAQKLK